jgi:hypothetical protein
MLMLRNYEVVSGNFKVVEMCINADYEHNHFRIVIIDRLIRNIIIIIYITEISANVCHILFHLAFLGLKILYDRTS